MSEMELSLFRQRSLEALKQKARRGELFLTVAIGYVKTSHDRIEKDPDRRVQEAIMLAFNKFAELQTVRQVHLWMRQERLPLPATEYGPEGRKVIWKLPVYNTLHHLLTNPIYAGAYVFGRTGSRITIEAGRKRIVRGFRRDRSSWEVLIRDHHEGYISWAEFERNLRLIADNANGKSFMSRGSSGAARRCWPACCDAGIAAASCMSPTAARTAARAAITVGVVRSTMAAIAASRSAACGSTALSVPR